MCDGISIGHDDDGGGGGKPRALCVFFSPDKQLSVSYTTLSKRYFCRLICDTERPTTDDDGAVVTVTVEQQYSIKHRRRRIRSIHRATGYNKSCY